MNKKLYLTAKFWVDHVICTDQSNYSPSGYNFDTFLNFCFIKYLKEQIYNFEMKVKNEKVIESKYSEYKKGNKNIVRKNIDCF